MTTAVAAFMTTMNFLASSATLAALTFERAGGGDISAEAKKFMVVMNAATSIVSDQVAVHKRCAAYHSAGQRSLRRQGAANGGVKKAYTMVSDYGPGHRRRAGFQTRLQGRRRRDRRRRAHAGGQPGFLGFRAARQGPQSGGDLRVHPRRRAAGGDRQGARGARHRHKKIKMLGRARLTDDSALKSMGDAALGIITVFHYDWKHKSKLNEDFVEGVQGGVQAQSRLLLDRRL